MQRTTGWPAGRALASLALAVVTGSLGAARGEDRTDAGAEAAWLPGGRTVETPTAGPTDAEGGSQWLFGNWGGHRERLEEKGWKLEAGYVGEVLGTIAGGLRRGVVAEGLAQISLEVDLEKAVRWSGGTFHVCGLFPHGESPSQELVGDIQTLSNIDAFRDDPELYECYLDQRFGKGAFSLRLGLLLADSEFVASPAAGDFFNSGFGWPSAISLNTHSTGPAFFRTALGARIRYDPNEHWFMQAGVYDGDTFDGDPERDVAIRLHLGGDDGFFTITEIGRRWNSSEDSPGLPGQASVAGWFHTGNFAEHLDANETDDRTGGVLFTGEQTVWRDDAAASGASRRSLASFVRFGWSPPETGLSDWSGDAGVRFRGLLPERFQDAISLGAAWIHLSHEYRTAYQAAHGEVPRHAEVALECTWAIALTPWCVVQPDYQWVHAVEGGGGDDDAHVLGLRTRLSF